MIIIPIAITAATLGTLYYTRDPVRELRRGKSYRIGLSFNAPVFQQGAGGQIPAGTDMNALLNNQIPIVLQNALTGMGFTNVRKVSGPGTPANGVYTYWFDGTWSREDRYVQGELPAYLNVAVYEKLF